ncbi:hypothetical protein N6H14_22655 [Paenibacillus sp. CC-CFT747]|nr:hypothetical protein N6H14_22655 [Paenibacillus sp. CC-CFT747]
MELMQRDLDQDLTIAEQRTLLKHIRQCPECAAVFERLQRISDELEQLPAVIPPFSIVDSILPRLAEADGLREQSASSDVIPVPAGRRIGKGFSWKIGTGVAAAAAVLGLVVFNGGNIGRNDKNSTAASNMAGGYREEASTPVASQQRTMADSAMESAGNEPKADVKSEETTKSLAQATPSPATGVMAEPSPTLTADAARKLQASTTPKATPGKGAAASSWATRTRGMEVHSPAEESVLPQPRPLRHPRACPLRREHWLNRGKPIRTTSYPSPRKVL